MALSTQPYKGARDFYPEDKRLQKYIFKTMRDVVERFGYEEYDAPILEPIELYMAKSGAEIVNEQTYTFEDRGGRKVAIRPEMTPTVSRMVAARRQELGYPLRLYSIPNLWRYERPQKGRLREHWQLNVDIFGVADSTAEDEMIKLSNAIMKAFGATPDMYEFKLNSRSIINYLFTNYLELDESKLTEMIQLVDHYHKMEPEKFSEAVSEIVADNEKGKQVSEKLGQLLSAKSLDELPGNVPDELTKGLREPFNRMDAAGIKNYSFDTSLMRGFAYYTDIVFEVYDTNPENNRSMFGGGRYDGLVGLFGVEPVPTVGFGMGDVTLKEFIESHNLTPKLKSETDLYVGLLGENYDQTQPLITSLREQGVNVSVDSSGGKFDKQIRSAVKKGINHILFIGDNELSSGKFKIKNLDSGEENEMALDAVAAFLKAN